MKKEKTYFISFEGIDGCGKDTQLNKLIETIKEDDNYPFGNKYSNIWATREPTKMTESGTKIALLIRKRDVTGEEATRYYIQDRKEHTSIIKNILKHSHVLTSRYDLSTLAYQMTQGMEFNFLYDLHNYNKPNGCIEPDLTLIFDLPVEIALKRMNNRNSQEECFEKKEFQEKLKDNLFYCINELKKKGRKIIIINANQSIENVKEEMISKINEILNEE